MPPTAQQIIDIARLFLFVRETKELQNRGLRVEAIQHWSGGTPGDSWCCEFATFVLDIGFAGNSPIIRTGSCEFVHQLAISNHWIRRFPAVGDLFFYVNSSGHAHHIGFVTAVGSPTTGIAGNTSPDGLSSNGDGVHEHEIGPAVFGRYLPDEEEQAT